MHYNSQKGEKPHTLPKPLTFFLLPPLIIHSPPNYDKYAEGIFAIKKTCKAFVHIH